MSPETVAHQVARSVNSSLNGNTGAFGKAFLEGLRKNDLGVSMLMVDAEYNVNKRDRRAIATAASWACRLMRLSSMTGVGHSRIVNFITNRIPQRWRGMTTNVLVAGGAKRLVRWASVLCGVSGGGSTFTANNGNLVKVYEQTFLDGQTDPKYLVSFETFMNFVDWYKSSVGSGFQEAQADLMQIKADVVKVLFKML